MTEEQLNKEAEDHADRLFGEKARYSSDIDGFLYGRTINAYKAGHHSRDKEVEELEQRLKDLQDKYDEVMYRD